MFTVSCPKPVSNLPLKKNLLKSVPETESKGNDAYASDKLSDLKTEEEIDNRFPNRGTKEEAKQYKLIVSAIAQEPENKLPIQQYTIGVSNENRSIESFVIGEGEDVILIMASIHGDETAGTSLVLRLAEYLREHPITLEGRKVMIMPLVNPDGRERNTRYNSRGVDLNRNFSTGNRINNKQNGLFPLSEPETRAIVRAIRQCKPNRIVAVHQPLACIDYDGPGRDLADHIAKYCELPVRKLGAMPGSLGSYAGLMLDIPTVTLELPQGKSSSEYLWEQYGAALIAAILYPQPIDFSIHTELIPLKKQKACLGRCFFSCQ